MKKHYLTILTFFLITGLHAQTPVDFEKEKAAIFSTFKAEKEGFALKNMELMKQNILANDSYIYIYINKGTRTLTKGFSEQKKNIRSYWDYVGDEKNNIQNDFQITEIKIYPNSAWLAIENKWKYLEENPIRNGIDLETLFMEKIDGKWKISAHQIVSSDLTIYSIGLVGTSLPGGWNISVDMKKSNKSSGVWEGVFDFKDGEVKFRANNEWYINWGGYDFPSGDMVTDGPNIKVPKGKYQVSINLETKKYSFTEVK